MTLPVRIRPGRPAAHCAYSRSSRGVGLLSESARASVIAALTTRFGSVSPQGSVNGSDRWTGASPAASADIRSFCKAGVHTALVAPDDAATQTPDNLDDPVDPELDAIADELYALLPQDFTDARNARAKAVKSAGNRELASAIGALRKPSNGAWVVSQLVRERADLVDQLLDLADALRSAQETLSGPELRALSAQRHRVI